MKPDLNAFDDTFSHYDAFCGHDDRRISFAIKKKFDSVSKVSGFCPSCNFDLQLFLTQYKMNWKSFTFISFIKVEFYIYHFTDIFTDADKFTDKFLISKKNQNYF